MFDSPEDVERSIDIIEATVGFSFTFYDVAFIVVTGPTVGVFASGVLALVWAGRALYRAIQ